MKELTTDLSLDEAYRYLAVAIVEKAIQDYRKAVIDGNGRAMQTLEKFFRGEWFYFLTNGRISGDKLIREVKAWKTRRFCLNPTGLS